MTGGGTRPSEETGLGRAATTSRVGIVKYGSSGSLHRPYKSVQVRPRTDDLFGSILKCIWNVQYFLFLSEDCIE